MNNRIILLGKAITISMAFFVSVACTTLNSKQLDGVGYPFAGMKDTPMNFKCAVAWSPTGLLAMPVIVIDVPLSFVADLIFLPFDLANKKTERKGNRTCF